ncbi:hypothetical protein ACFLZV_06660 [Candidatus Margulisiibacteriota bacterium]
MKITHNKNLDKDKKLEKQAMHYDNSDLEEEFDFSHGTKRAGKNKRVNMLLKNDLYEEALRIGEITGAGYQNTLKMAIAIGLRTLINKVQSKEPKSKTKSTSGFSHN